MLDFPNNPVIGQLFPYPSIAGLPTWVWDGEKWIGHGIGEGGEGGFDPSMFVLKAGDTMTGPLALASGSPLLSLNKTSRNAGENVVNGRAEDLLRWRMVFGNTTPETGDDLGDDFLLQRFADDGDLLDTVLAVQRANGVSTFTKPIALPNNPGNPEYAANKAYVDAALSGRVPTTAIGNYLELRAMTTGKLFSTEQMSAALNFEVQTVGDNVGIYLDFAQQIDFQINLNGVCGMNHNAIPAELMGRSGLIRFWNSYPSSLVYNPAHWSFDGGVAPNFYTQQGVWNLFVYTIWHPSLVHLNNIGGGFINQ